ncbi:MAG: hypothetical protein KDC38_08200, partial [Planctomycetes bacterium]|nr:hypothetical protein [Planctomycetota bacterium]
LRVTKLESQTDGSTSPLAVGGATELTLTGGSPRSGTLASGRDPWADSITARLLGDDDIPTIEVTIDGGPGPVTVTRTLRARELSILRAELRFDCEARTSRVTRTDSRAVWLLELRRVLRKTDGGLDRATADTRSIDVGLADRDLRATLEAIVSDPEPEVASATAALRVARWIQSEPIVESASRREWSPVLRIESLLARMDQLTSDEREELERWAGASAEFDDPGRRARAVIGLLRTERPPSASGLRLVLAQLNELPPAWQYEALLGLDDRWRTGSEEDRAAIFETIAQPDTFSFLPWSNEGLVESLWARAVAELPSTRTLPVLQRELQDLNPATGGGTFRVRALVDAVSTLVRGEALDLGECLEPLFGLMDTPGYSDIAFDPIADAVTAGRADDDDWERIATAVDETFKDGEPSTQARLDQALAGLLRRPELDPESRRRLWSLRVHRLANMPDRYAHQRQTLDRELIGEFGELEGPAPAPQRAPEWTARSEEWLERIGKAEASTFVTTESAAEFGLVEVELRMPNDRVTEVIRFDRYEVAEGVAIPRAESDASSVLLEPYQTGVAARQADTIPSRFRLSGSVVFLDRPSLRSTVRQSRAFRLLLGEDDYRPSGDVRVQQMISFRTLQWLRPIESPIPDWPATIVALVDGATDPDAARRDACLRVISEARLVEAHAALVALYEKEPTDRLAITLLALGDLRGRAELLGKLAEMVAADALAVLTTLAESGDREAIDRVLTWTVDPPARLNGQIFGFLRILESVARDHRQELDRPRWIETLIASLSQTSARHMATRLLRELTGEDFGYQRVGQDYPDRTERRAAEEAIIGEWREWYRRFSVQQSKSARD